jgi:integrase
MVMRQALQDGLIESNPVSAVARPKPEQPPGRVPDAAQVRAFLVATAGSEWEIPMLLAATTGARRSEVLALRWSDVSLDGRVTIRRGLHRLPSGELGFLDPKSDTARRTVPLLPVVAQRLRAWRTEQVARRLALADEWRDLDLVCERGDGLPLDPDAMTKAFKRLAHRAGLDPSTTLHGLRHAFCTELGRRNVHPKIVSTLAGHSDPAFTMRVYQHAWSEGADEAAAALSEALDL